MNQFINANENAFFDLLQNLNGSCMRFPDEQMPQGCEPQQADIGFEISPQDGRILLLVADGINYNGDSESLRQWFQDGVLVFDGIQALLSWLRDELSPRMEALPENEVSTGMDVSAAGSDSRTEQVESSSGQNRQPPPSLILRV